MHESSGFGLGKNRVYGCIITTIFYDTKIDIVYDLYDVKYGAGMVSLLRKRRRRKC